ncbi:MAG: ABC transporter substrate-binding protein [Firmicutes bacterium]|jgi:branched-chain amino acid transport system substrate-binding protein|nr:ABC transporter substrate-binding protein [Bacillota bacterium]
MKRFSTTAAVLLIAMALVAGCAGQATKPAEQPKPAEPAKPKTIKIGCTFPLSGSSAELGQRTLRGINLAVEEINAAGGINGKLIEVVPMDDRADPKEAANVANLFASNPEILAVIGHNNSSCTLAGAPIYNKAGLPHISPDSSSPKITDAGPYTFRVRNSDAYTGAYNVQKMWEAGYRKIGILYENNDFGRGGLEVGTKTIKELGSEPAATEAFMLGETKDFSTAITNFKKAGVEAIYLVGDYTEIALFCKQAHQMGYRPSVWGATGAFNPAIIKLAGEDAEGIVGSTVFYPDDPRPEVKEYVKKFVERYKSEGITQCDAFSPNGYDSLRIIAEAIKKNGESREGIKNYLTTLKDFPGVIGKITFDENGDVKIPLKLFVIKNGDFVPWEVGK